MTACLPGVMIFLNMNERQDRGRIFQEYDGGCIRNSRTHQKGEDAEGIRCLKLCSWACREQRHDCHRRMESYLIYDKYISGRRILPFLLLYSTFDTELFHIINKRRKKEWQFLKVQV